MPSDRTPTEEARAMLDKIEWEPLPDGWEDHTVFVGGRPIPVAEFIQNYPSAERRQGDDE